MKRLFALTLPVLLMACMPGNIPWVKTFEN